MAEPASSVPTTPALEGAASVSDHPRPDRHDQAALLGYRDEVRRTNGPPAGCWRRSALTPVTPVLSARARRLAEEAELLAPSASPAGRLHLEPLLGAMPQRRV